MKLNALCQYFREELKAQQIYLFLCYKMAKLHRANYNKTAKIQRHILHHELKDLEYLICCKNPTLDSALNC